MKQALITGVTGQDGTYLTALLLKKGYAVYGASVHEISKMQYTNRLQAIEPSLSNFDNLYLCKADITKKCDIENIFNYSEPNEIYHLAAQSSVAASFENPVKTSECNAFGALQLLDVMYQNNLKKVRFFNASSAELFGQTWTSPQNELTPFHPHSPYAISKMFAHQMTVCYRKNFGLHCSNGILFNHESPLREPTFVTKKIISALFQIALGNKNCLYLGNLDAKKDWGHARDFVNAMWLMLQQDKPEDYVIATGKQYSVRDFVELSANKLGIELKWFEKNLDEVAFDKNTKEKLIAINPQFFRPAETSNLVGDSSKAKCNLNWEPRYSLEDTIDDMIKYEKNQINFLTEF